MSNYTSPPLELPPGSTVWAYLRDSGGPTQDRSVSQQRDVLETYCQRHGLHLTLVFADVHKSGTSDEREQFYEMMDMTVQERMRPDGLLIWSFARFARNTLDSQYHKAVLRKRGIVIHSLIDDLPGGKYQIAFEAILDIANQEKAEQASREARRGLNSIVSKDGAMPGTPPRGFKREPFVSTSAEGVKRTLHRWEPDPEWVPRVRKAFEMRAAGASLADINRETRLFGSLNSYRTFWNNKLYVGVLEYGDLVIPDYCAPLVDRETWDRVQLISRKYTAHMHMSSERDHPRRAGSSYLFSGLVRCARCQAPMFGQTSPQRNGTTVASYRCTRAMRRRDCDLPRIPGHALELAILDELKRAFRTPELYIFVYRQAQAERQVFLDKQAEQRKDLEKRIQGVNRKIKNVTAAIAAAGHTPALLAELNTHEIDRSDLQEKINKIRHRAVTPLEQLSDEQLAASAKHIGQILSGQDDELKRRVLRGLIEEILVDRVENNITGVITIGIDETPPPSDDGNSLKPPSPTPGNGSGPRPKTVPKTQASMGAHIP